MQEVGLHYRNAPWFVWFFYLKQKDQSKKRRIAMPLHVHNLQEGKDGGVGMRFHAEPLNAAK